MPRLGEVTKHPAITAKHLASINRNNRLNIEKSDLWHELTGKQKEFLAYYSMLRDGVAAADRCGLPVSWIEEQDSPAFTMMMLEIQHQPKAFAMQVVQEMIPWTVFELRDIIINKTGKEKTGDRIKAIQHIHHLAGMAAPKDGAVNQVLQASQLQVNMWNAGDE